MRFLTFLLASCIGFQGAFAAPIAEVKTSGLKRIERAAILEKILSRPGTEYDADRIRTDIESLYEMGYFDDIVISKDPAPNGVVLTFAFAERPLINEILFEGNEKIPTSDLQEAIKVKKWSILDVNKVQADIEIIQKQYEDKGYYLAKVSHELRPDKVGEVKLVYKVSDYDKVEIKRIVFLNNRHYTDEKLKGVFGETKEGSSLGFFSNSGTFREASFKMDLQRLTYWYLENGYLKFRHEAPVTTISEDKRYVFISIYVEEGERYSIGSFDFSGDLLFSREDLRKEIQMGDGQVFSITGRNADIQRLTEKYQDLGYAFVNVIPKMDFNDELKTVSLDYSFEKGSLVRFGEIRVVGNTKTYDRVIRRELRIYEGELYSGSKLRVSRERVERLGFFAPGEVQFNQIPRKGRDDVVDIEIVVKERSTGSVTLGAGYSSVQGFFFQGRIQEINLFGRGQNLSFETQWGRQDLVRSFSLSFLDPYAFDTKWSAGFDLFMANSPIPDRYLIRRSGFNLRAGYPITDDVQGFVTYKFEHLRVLANYAEDRNALLAANPSLGLPPLRADDSLDKGILSSVVLTVTRDKRNNRFETTGGNFQNASLEIAGLGGVKNFAKFTANNRYYNNFIGNFVFKNSTEIGALFNTGGRGIPPSEKFFLGGPWNMRGFDVFSLSPVSTFLDPNTGVATYEKLGGVSQFYSLFELEHPLIREAGIKWVLFYDVGNSFAGFPGIDPEDPNNPYKLRQNYGFGIRWFSPLGPLRFEWGFPVNPGLIRTTGQVEASPSFIFFIGQPF